MKMNRYFQSGTSLLEVLISIIVLALGLLGYAGLQSVSMKNNHNAYMRSQATVLASDGLDRLRVNFTGGTASADIAAWKTEVANVLPSGVGDIQLLANNKVRVTVTWRDTGDNAERTFITESKVCDPNPAVVCP